jgi:uncharacterized protein YbcV (DUF1398 family)
MGQKKHKEQTVSLFITIGNFCSANNHLKAHKDKFPRHPSDEGPVAGVFKWLAELSNKKATC